MLLNKCLLFLLISPFVSAKAVFDKGYHMEVQVFAARWHRVANHKTVGTMLLFLFLIAFGCTGVLGLEPVVGNWTVDVSVSVNGFDLTRL
jgi:hypothetical protein